MIYEGKAAFLTFVAALSWFGLVVKRFDWEENQYYLFAFCFLVAALHLVVLLYVLLKSFQIFWRSYLLGSVFLFGLWLIQHAPSVWGAFGWYLCVLALFHISEYLATAAFNPYTLKSESFLINHSPAYNLAHLACCLEYAAWCWCYPNIKGWKWVQYAGLIICIFGDLFRKTAMFTAGINFTHMIQFEKKKGHTLVTSGVYSVCRHPSYAGWFFWSIGTQVLACNPICFIAYALASWKFFDERIYEEEILLLNFFQVDYMNYQSRVPTGVPFVKGYMLREHERQFFQT